MTHSNDSLDVKYASIMEAEKRRGEILSTWWDFTREDMVILFTRLGITAEKANALWELTDDELNFVQRVERNSGCKLSDATVYRGDEIITPWTKPEKLGLIHCVGSYKWEPGPKPEYPEPTPETHPRPITPIPISKLIVGLPRTPDPLGNAASVVTWEELIAGWEAHQSTFPDVTRTTHYREAFLRFAPKHLKFRINPVDPNVLDLDKVWAEDILNNMWAPSYIETERVSRVLSAALDQLTKAVDLKGVLDAYIGKPASVKLVAIVNETMVEIDYARKAKRLPTLMEIFAAYANASIVPSVHSF